MATPSTRIDRRPQRRSTAVSTRCRGMARTRAGLLWLACTAGLLPLVGCAPLHTAVQSKTPVKGLIYFLPKKMIRIDYVRKPGDGTTCVETLSLSTTKAMPDTPAGTFVVSVPVNQLGANDTEISVNAQGLLQSASAKVTSDLAAIVSDTVASVVAPGLALNSAGSCIATSRSRLVDVPLAPSCEDGICIKPSTSGTHRFDIELRPAGLSPSTLGARIEVPVLTGNPPFNSAAALAADDAGLFYRMELPYLVRHTRGSGTPAAPDASTTPILWIPNESPVGFAPVRRSLFGDKTTTMTFSDGSLTDYDADYHGDLLSLVRLPVTVIGAVSTAIGKVASARNANADAEIGLMTKSLELEQAKLQYERCRRALAENDKDRIDELCKD